MSYPSAIWIHVQTDEESSIPKSVNKLWVCYKSGVKKIQDIS